MTQDSGGVDVFLHIHTIASEGLKTLFDG
ncbi:hypothetical protein [Photobacterium toruni]